MVGIGKKSGIKIYRIIESRRGSECPQRERPIISRAAIDFAEVSYAIGGDRGIGRDDCAAGYEVRVWRSNYCRCPKLGRRCCRRWSDRRGRCWWWSDRRRRYGGVGVAKVFATTTGFALVFRLVTLITLIKFLASG